MKKYRKYWWIFLAIVLLALLAGAYYYWNWYQYNEIPVVTQSANQGRDTNAEKSKPGTTNFLLMGSDARGDEASRADVIMVISADFATKKVSVISVPRDTRVNLPGVGLTKINHANSLGEAKGGVHEGTLATAQAVSDLLSIDINYYAKIDFEGFKSLVDVLGGVDVDLPYDVNDDVQQIYLTKGTHHLNGDEALRLARARFGLPNGDLDRQRNQYLIMTALGEEALAKENISKLPNLIKVGMEQIQDTNIKESEALGMGLALTGTTMDDVKYYQLPGHPLRAVDPLVGAEVYYFEPDQTGIDQIMREIEQG